MPVKLGREVRSHTGHNSDVSVKTFRLVSIVNMWYGVPFYQGVDSMRVGSVSFSFF